MRIMIKRRFHNLMLWSRLEALLYGSARIPRLCCNCWENVAFLAIDLFPLVTCNRTKLLIKSIKRRHFSDLQWDRWFSKLDFSVDKRKKMLYDKLHESRKISWKQLTLARCELIQLTNVFFWTRSCSSRKKIKTVVTTFNAHLTRL